MWIFWIIPITFLWAVMNIIIKKLQNNNLSSEYILLLSWFFATLILLVANNFIYWIDFENILNYSYIWVIGYFSFILLMNSFRYINIWLAVLISNLSVIFASILNYIVLAEVLGFYKQIILFLIFSLLWIYAYIHYKGNNKNILKWLLLAFFSSILAWIWYFIVNYNVTVTWMTGFELKTYTLVWGLFVLALYIFLYKWLAFVEFNTNRLNLNKFLIIVVLFLAIVEIISDSAFFFMYNYYAWTLLTVLALFEIVFSFLLWFLIFKEKNIKLDYIIFSLIFVLLILFMI